jgi:hypothetical protein
VRIDGYQVTSKSKTGLALFVAGLSSFIDGTVAIVCRRGMLPIREPDRISRGNANQVGDVVPFGGNICYAVPIQVVRFLLKLLQNWRADQSRLNQIDFPATIH